MKRKGSFVILIAVLLSMVFAGTAFAGTWKQGGGVDEGRWWYERDDGSYPAGGWEWIDGNYDGVSECYYFDSEGWMYADTTTPDGYYVNASGAWIENDVVQIKIDLGTVYNSQNVQNDVNTARGAYDENILMPVYKDFTIFNPDRSDVKKITMSCDTGCKMYFTVGVNPKDPTEEDELYQSKRDKTFNIIYGNPSLKPGYTLKVVAIRTEDGARSGVTTIRYEDAHAGNKNRNGNISASSNPDNSSYNNNNTGSSSGSTTGPRLCPVCAGQGTTICTYCHGTGKGQNATIGIGGDVWQGTCPGCGGAKTKTCAGCGGTGYIGY